MQSLREMMNDPGRFVCGVELVTTRGTFAEAKAVKTRDFANQLVGCNRVDWVSITDNAGGNPMLSPTALGKPILYGGKEVIIHLSCKDFNRNGIESQAWQLSSDGFHNILALSGDAPVTGYSGRAKAVFDIDSVGLLTLLREMNEGLGVWPHPNAKPAKPLRATNFLVGVVTTNFKLHQNEVVPQYLKLEKKLQAGRDFIIAQIGYDARKYHEQKVYMDRHEMGHVPLIGNVFVLTGRVAAYFNSGRIPGVVVSDELCELCKKQAESADKGRAFFLELAAKQVAIFKGLGYKGGEYLGGVHNIDQIDTILDIAETFAEDDWKQFAREISFSRPDEFFMYAPDKETGLVDPDHLNPDYEKSLKTRKRTKNVNLNYRLSKFTHDIAFTPGKGLFNLAKKIYSKAKNVEQGPAPLRLLEHVSKTVMFGCKDCGDCSLPDIAFRCPESCCAKNQRNGPCGGTRDGKCEVQEFECIWAIAYDRLKYEGREEKLLEHAPVIQDESLRGTSSWANMYLGKDHSARHLHHLRERRRRGPTSQQQTEAAPAAPSAADKKDPEKATTSHAPPK